MIKFGKFEVGIGYRNNLPSLIYRNKNRSTTLLICNSFKELSSEFIDKWKENKDNPKSPFSEIPYKQMNYIKGKIKNMKENKNDLPKPKLVENKIRQIVKKILKEESTVNFLTVNVGGTRYEIYKNGTVKRLGSESMNYGSNFKLIGATSFFGNGNRTFKKSDSEISLNDIFNNPDILVGKYPLISFDGKIDTLLRGSSDNVKESNFRVLWVK
jgi:hypothetical protein